MKHLGEFKQLPGFLESSQSIHGRNVTPECWTASAPGYPVPLTRIPHFLRTPDPVHPAMITQA